jgi:hypothetical protein
VKVYFAGSRTLEFALWKIRCRLLNVAIKTENPVRTSLRMNYSTLMKLSVVFRKSVKTWLAPYDPLLYYEKSLDTFHEGTGRWFLEGVFDDWLESPSQSVLWLRARRERCR